MARALSHINGNPMLHVASRSNLSRPGPLILHYYYSYSYRRPLKLKVAVMSSCDQSYWASVDSDIEAHLKQSISLGEPLSVYEPMHDLTFAAPPTTAPSLCVAACELVGGRREQALPAASAIRLMHASSFALEHVQLKGSNRPKSTIRHVYSPETELVIAKAMIPFGLGLLAKSDDQAHDDSERVLRVMVEITRARGSEGIVYGQYKEVEHHQSVNKESWSDIGEMEGICEKYEGALHACAAACGSILGGGSEEEIEKMRRYGLYIGKIQGMLNRIGSHSKDLKELIEELRNLASKELRGFDEAMVETISSYFESNVMHA